MRIKPLVITPVLVLLMVIALLPSFFSTKTGTNFLVNNILKPWVFGPKGYYIQIENMELSWFGPQKANQIWLSNETSKISIENVTSEASLFRPFSPNNRNISNVTIEGEEGKFQIEQLESKFSKDTHTLKILGKSDQKPFTVQALFPLDIDWNSMPKAIPKLEHVEITMDSLPVALMDWLARNIKNTPFRFFTEALGNKLNLTLHPLKAGTSFSIDSDHLHANLVFTDTKEGFRLAKKGGAEWTITKAFSSLLNSYLKTPKLFPTERDSLCEIFLDKLEWILPQNQWLGEISAQAQFPSGLIKEVLGPKTNVKAYITKDSVATLSVLSETLQWDNAKFHLGKKISLIQPTEIQLLLKSEAINGLLQFPIVSASTPIKIQAKKLETDFTKIFHILMNISQPEIYVWNEWKISNIRTNVEGDLFHEFSSHTNGKIALGTTISLDALLEANFQKSKSGYKISEYFLTLAHPRGEAHFSGNVQKLFLTTKGDIHYQLDNEDWEKMGLVQKDHSYPSGKTEITAQIPYLKIPLTKDHFFDELETNGFVDIDTISLHDLASIKGLQLRWNLDGKTNQIENSLTAKTYDLKDKKSGILTSVIEIKNWHLNNQLDFSQLICKADTKIKNLPLSFFETLFHQKHLHGLLGSVIDLEWIADFDLSKETPGEVEIKLFGKQLQLEGKLEISESIRLKDPNRPILALWTVTPERFKAIRQLLSNSSSKKEIDSLMLNEEASIQFRIYDFSIPWMEKKPQLVRMFQPYFGLTHLAGSANLSLNNLSITDSRTKKNAVIEHIDMQFSTTDLLRAITLSIASEPESHSKKDAIFFQLDALLDHPLTEEGSWNQMGLSFFLESTAKNIPLGLFCDVALLSDQMVDQLDALIGSKLDNLIEIRVKHGKGTIQADLRGTLGTLNVDGNLENGFFTLNQPLTASLHVTPKLGHSVLQPLVPFLSTAYRSDKPITISISEEGFQFPFLTGDLSQIRIEKGMVDFGRVYFHYGKQIEEILSVLNFSIPSDKGILVWFTPLYFSMKENVVECKRTDMLIAELFPVAMWGKVDFGNDKVRLMLGLSGKALKNAFGIQGVPNEALLQLPLRGSTSAAQIDKSKSVARVASLIAHAKGGAEGAVIGSLVDILSGTLGEKKPPKPTTYPFPWSDNSQESQAEESSQKAGPEQWIEKGAKEIMKFIQKKL